ncbi:hypothetical protein B0J15DRAFT_133769 [Fusarium solani]|uniref:Uncharacterized protein n=1 Tax=Fusarium solani TaxID=169388 RepID=A0A9P9RDY6_FUSSL|nr:uncharacterized protein B0J15DRAFT_133769 [Fusarium solani]KAH7274555.1 hypothetical protein B0J15DRAFT_133769 [Fusarium solani]
MTNTSVSALGRKRLDPSSTPRLVCYSQQKIKCGCLLSRAVRLLLLPPAGAWRWHQGRPSGIWRCIPTRTRRGGSKSYDGGCLLDLVVSFSLFPPRVPDARWLVLKMRSGGGPRHGHKRRIAAAHNRAEGLRSDLHLLVWDLPGGLVLSCMVR